MLRLKLAPLSVFVVAFAAILTSCGGVSGNAQSASFTISASPSSVTVVLGTSNKSTITINPLNGFNSSVTLSATGLPSGVSASFNPSSTTNSSTLTLTASATAPLGTTTVKITGTSGSLTNSTPLSLSVLKTGQINHVVIIFQENRTPDNLFHDQNLINAGADIASTGKTSTGATVTLTPVPLVTTYDLGHSHAAFLSSCQWNGTQCAMDGADLEPCSGQGCPAQNAAYQYVQASDVQPYFDLAEAYTFGDRMFQTNEGPSFPAHQYILSGTSAVCVPGGNCPSGMTNTFYVADNPSGNERSDGTYGAGCLAPPDSVLNIIDTSQPFPNKALSHITGPECFEHPTLTDVLDANGLSWKYYAALPGDIWTAPNVIEHMCQPSGPADDNTCSGPDWTAPDPKVVIEGSGSQVTTDIQNGQLAAVTWVIPTGANSDHAAGNDGGGPSWVASIVNTIGASQFWSDTAIIITWDDWGGWYDHVAPQIRNTNSYEYGFRVPLIVVSPYAKQKYVSHQVNDFGSILKFIEEVFSLPAIDPSVGYADSYAVGDLSDCFDFGQSPQPFTQIKAPLKTEYFQNNKAPATPPDND